MKKIILLFTTFSMCILLGLNSIAQIGSTCVDAHPVTALPFSVTGLSTSTSGNNYSSLPCSGTFPNYMSGNDYVFEYTALYNHNISIVLTNTGVSAAVFVTSECPDVATACVAFNTSTMGNPVINSASLTAGITYYITVSTVGALAQTTDFDIEIMQLYDFDAAVTNFITPASNCGLSNAEVVKIMIKNFGTQAISNFNVGYSINGVAITPEIISSTLNAGDTMSYTFTVTADLSTTATYQFDAYVILQGDENTLNDTLNINIANQTYVNVLPYSEDFENGDGGWTAGGSSPSWELGTPNGNIINLPASGGTNSWVTNLTGTTNLMENSYVIGPCFDFTNYQNVSIKMDIWYQTSPMMDAARLEASINGGVSWFIIGGNNEPTNWYNAMMTDTGWSGSAGGWLTAQHPLNFLGGQSDVRLRVVFKTGMMSFMPDEGFGFDNILIYECNDMPTADFTFVQNGSTVIVTNNSADATSYLWNYGDQMAMLPDTNTNSSYTYMMDGTYTITLAAFNECGVSYSSQSVNITTVGINENTTENIAIFPNPTNNILNIKFNNPQEINRIQVFNVLGQEVFSSEYAETVNVCKWNKGIYFINFVTDTRVFSERFIIE